MSFDIESAKKAGYSDQEIESFLKKQIAPKKFDSEAAKKAGYSDSEIDEFLKKDISKTRSVLSAPIKGAIKGAEELSHLADPTQILLQSILPKKESLLSKVTEQVLPTKNETAERFLERTGKLAPLAALGGGGLASSALQALGGGALGQLAQEEGIGEAGQAAAELAGMGLPGLAKALGRKAISLVKAPVEKLASGLTKPRAIEGKLAEKAIITPARQEKIVDRLNKEASKLSETTLKKEVPLSEQIKNGVDFESQFEQRFGQLQNMAEKANPDIDITPVSKFMSETASKYRGIPKLHPEAAKIKTEIKAFGNHAPIDLKSGLRTYRSNNKKIKGIYETSRLTGKQQEYVDFLVDYNKNIAKSFENTLPKDSQWIKEFKDTNQFYKNYKDAQKAMHLIEPILGQKATPSSLQKFADDPKLYKKLELSMGKKGADEIVQIAKDLQLATESIKKIPAKDLKWFESILPIGVFIPGVQIPGGAITAKKIFDFSRRGYGWFLSSPARRKAYDDALKGLLENNRPLYVKGAEELQKSFQEKESD